MSAETPVSLTEVLRDSLRSLLSVWGGPESLGIFVSSP
jgi:hypothetical protein